MTKSSYSNSMKRLSSLLGTKIPLIQAPMYHYSNANLVVEVCNSHALGCLGAASIEHIQQHTQNPFAVNLFLLPKHLFRKDPAPRRLQDQLNRYREELGIPTDPKGLDFNQDIDEQVDIICRKKVPVVIFTFGVPGRHIVQRLTQAGCVLLGSATSAKEAVALEESGVHAVICQGTEAGGHRTSAMLPESGDLGLMSLVPLVKAHTSLPVIAAGGIVNATQIRAAMAAGADGVSMGTIFLTSKECSTPQSHRDHIFNLDRDAKTVVTRIFTGRPARMLENRFYKEMSAIWQELPASERDLPWDFYCRDIFGTAARSNRPDLFILWGGQSVNLLAGKPTRPARDIIREIAADMGWSDNNLSTGAANHE